MKLLLFTTAEEMPNLNPSYPTETNTKHACPVNVSGEQAFRVAGHVKAHSHMHFNDAQFYVISGDRETDYQLSTFALHENSAIQTAQLTLHQADYRNVVARFSENHIFFSENSFSSDAQIQTISLDDPINPVLSYQLNLPTQLQQFLISGDSLIGTGLASIDHNNSSVGTVTAFDITQLSTSTSGSGYEGHSVLLGADYRRYNTPSGYDDQILNIDASINRLFIPYSVYSPINFEETQSSDFRLSLIDFDGDSIAEEHTFSLLQIPQRTLSVDENSAYAFSANYIYALNNSDEWRSRAIFDGSLPQSVYFSREHPVHVQKYSDPAKTRFKLIDSDDSAQGELLDEVSILRAATNACLVQHTYFDQDRILSVKEKPGTYLSREDCPDNFDDIEIIYVGFRIGATSVTPIDDQDELIDLHKLILLDLVCITDVENRDGKVIAELPGQSEDVACFSHSEYSRLRYSEK